MAFEAVLKKIEVQWLANWIAAKSHSSYLVQQLVAYLLLQQVIYKLIKSDNLTQSHPQFNSIRAHLEVLSSKKVVYERHIRSQTTNHNEYGPNILEYICNSLLCNLSLLRSFNMLLDIASSCQHVMAEKQELKDDVRMFFYKRIVYIYMRKNLKGMNNDTQTSPKIDKKLMLIKKTNIPTDPLLGLKQLQIWAQLDGAEE
ncbi:11454_t:CDS:2 [Cetraspora pellucida]|uniref:11454_t:CDS:1 n=1 Tax=Cetraspora pellucida TaxID=1433469 RepID=A0ACA9MHV5_9GLOM|nr:11454_t:CDS:2 [Cetraspora pellucida]